MDTPSFIKTIYNYYAQHKRVFAWRDVDDPYLIFISEVMLQQTQTFRVEPKFAAFVLELPNFEALANAPFAHVLGLWKGLGYNRRALYLQQAAQKISQEWKGMLAREPKALEALPGIGPATARSILTFAFNEPHVFIETNIRAVFIAHFFAQCEKVHDKEIFPLIEQTMDRSNPRQWYYALMDYGTMLKKTHQNPSRKSAHHTRQSKFEGSDRQIRGRVLELLLRYHTMSGQELAHALMLGDSARLERILNGLRQEQLVRVTGNGHFCL